MGFSWTPIEVGDEILAAHINEVKTNLDSLYDDLQLSHYNFVELPVNVGDEIKRDQFNEMRAATDYADDMNYCRAHKATYHGTVDNDVNTGVDNTDKIGYDSSYDSGYDSALDGTVDGTDDYGYDGSYNSGVDNNEHRTYYSSYKDEYLSGEDSPVDGSENISV